MPAGFAKRWIAAACGFRRSSGTEKRRNKLPSLMLSVPRQAPLPRELNMKTTVLTVTALFLASAALAAEKPSQTFLKKAIEGNYAEVQMGQLAQKNGQSDGVKQFGQMLST